MGTKQLKVGHLSSIFSRGNVTLKLVGLKCVFFFFEWILFSLPPFNFVNKWKFIYSICMSITFGESQWKYGISSFPAAPLNHKGIWILFSCNQFLSLYIYISIYIYLNRICHLKIANHCTAIELQKKGLKTSCGITIMLYSSFWKKIRRK